MNDGSDFYTSSITDEVATALQSTIQKVVPDWDIGNLVVRHLTLASDALEREKAKRTASSFCQNHGALNPVQLDRAKSLLSEKASAIDASTLAAAACSMSAGHFERCFRASAGMSPHRWITNSRMKTAKHLLMNTVQSIADVARQCGYTEQCHFTRIFTREVGMSPGAWRRLLNNLLRRP
jgi:AraC family transcriptional regulator